LHIISKLRYKTAQKIQSFQKKSKFHNSQKTQLYPIFQIRSTYKSRPQFQIDLAQMLIQMGRIYSNSNQLESAIHCLEECLQIAHIDFPKSLKTDEIALKIAVIYSKLGEKEKAKTFLKQALDLSLCLDFEHFQMQCSIVGELRRELGI
jgi:tetratricopeptide (TPR) repeat protein